MKNKKYYKTLAQDVMINFTDKEIDEIAANDAFLCIQFEKVLKINTDHVRPMFYPYDDIYIKLREDMITSTITQTSILKNSPAHNNEFITIKRVVK